MAGTLITSIQTFMGGMAKSISKLLMPANKYFDAQNVTYLPETEGSEGGVSGALGTEFRFERENIQIAADTDDYKGYRIVLDLSAGAVHEITYTIPSAAPVTLSISSASFDPETNYNSLVTQINSDAFLSAYITPMYSGGSTQYIGIRGYGSDFTLTETIDSISIEVITIKEFYGTAANGQMVLVNSFDIGDNLFMIETNGSIFKWTVFQENPITGNIQYTTLLETNTIQIPVGSVIDIDGEISNSIKVSLYFTGTGVAPRALYVNLQNTWVENSAVQYDESFGVEENNDAYATYDNIEQISKLQILENFARAELVAVNNSGGGQTTGSKMHTVRQSIGRENATGFFLVGNPIPIFLDSLTETNLHGDESGLVSNKSITLNITGLSPLLYDYFELVCIENNDGVLSAYIVGQYPITGESQQVTHTGFEQVSTITIAELSIQQVQLLGASSLVITRNRLFLSDIILFEQSDLTQWAHTITITTQKYALTACGDVNNATVGEYQIPANVNQRAGYMDRETYRIGIMPLFLSGFVGSPVHVSDYTIDSSAVGANLTNNDNVNLTPTEVYSFHPELTVDLSTASINGVPLANLIYGYSIVRQKCIPEVLATGYAMPAAQPQPIAGFFTAGTSVAEGVTYTEPSGSSRRTQISFLSPDILFGVTSIDPLQGDILLNHGQAVSYNSDSDTSVPNLACAITEYSSADSSFSPVQHIIDHGEVVPFNTDGVVDINGAKLRNLVSYSFAGIDPGVYGNNQKSIAIALNDFLNPINGTPDEAFYYDQYIRILSNKYGDQNSGNYIQCGHIRQITQGTDVYVDQLFGGDTFTEKSIIKFCNYYSDEPTNPSSLIIRRGVSIYTQNKGNYQLRNFTAGTTGDYPYTTSSLLNWLNINDQLEGQLLYSLSYTPTTLLLPKLAYNPNIETVTHEPSSMRYSQLKFQNSLLDAYRQFLILDVKPFPSVYGAIKNTFSNGNSIIVMMEQYICSQQVDLQQQQTDPNNQTTIIIGDGTVLGARESDISFIGAPIKTGAIQYLSKFGKRYFAWWNPFYKKVIIHTGQQLIDLGADNDMETFFVQNTQFSTSERSFFFTYDFYTSELLCIAKYELPDVFGYVDTDTYTKGQKVYINGAFSNPNYFIATENVPVGKDPLDVANFGVFWKPYRQSNFVLSYNERMNNPCSFYSYVPAYPMMMYRNTILSSPVSSLLLQNVYEHNIMTGKWYEDNIVSYITTILNKNNDIFKTGRNVVIDISQKPVWLYFEGLNGAKSFNSPSGIQQKRSFFWANFMNDARITSDNPTGSNRAHTQRISGEYIEVTVLFTNVDSVNTIDEISARVILKPPFNNI